MKIAFLGDIALIGKYDITKNPNVKERLMKLSSKLKEYDYVVGNLESPLTNKDKTMICKSMHLKSQVVNVELLKYLHINAVSLANNHSYDFGKKGIEETIKTLDNYGIEWFGVNSKYLLKKINGESLSISGFCCYSTNGAGYTTENKSEGINSLTFDNVLNQLDIDRDNNAFSALAFHWGDEHTNFPNFEHISLAKKIALKKDVVICGHHPHIIQGFQNLNNSVVAYSLGNFLFDDCTSITGNFEVKQNLQNKKSFILEVEIENGAIVNQRFIGFNDEEEGFSFFDIENELNDISEPLNIIDDIDKYDEVRRFQITKVFKEKFGKRNYQWLISRLNYYSIGAYITTKILKKKYLREVDKFLGDKSI